MFDHRVKLWSTSRHAPGGPTLTETVGSLRIATPAASMTDVWAALGTIGVIAVGALSLYLQYWMFHRRDWKWDEYEYPARPTGRPSPRAGLDEFD